MSFAYSGSFCWNALPRSLKTACSVSTFKSKALQSVLNRAVFSFLMFDNPGPSVCVQLCFKYMDIFSLDGEVIFLS